LDDNHDLDRLARSELERRERRNVRDRVARAFLRSHPEIVDDPDHCKISDPVPEGTTEAAVRAVARHYHRMRIVRRLLKEGSIASLEEAP